MAVRESSIRSYSAESLDTTNEHEAKDVTESSADNGQWWSPTQDSPQGLKALTEAPGMGGACTVSLWATVAPYKRIQGSKALGQAELQGQTQQGQWENEEKTDGQTDMRKSWDQVVCAVCWKNLIISEAHHCYHRLNREVGLLQRWIATWNCKIKLTLCALSCF